MYYYNMAGQRFILPERPLEPPNCWANHEPEEGEGDRWEDNEEYDRAEDEMNGKFNRLRSQGEK